MTKQYGFNVFFKEEQKKIADLKSISDRKSDRQTGRPENTGRPDDQKLDDRTTSADDQKILVDQLKLDDQKQSDESNYPSRTEKEKIGLRLPINKVKQYKMWCFVNSVSLQDAVEKAMDCLLDDQNFMDDRTTGRPVDHDLDRSEDLIDDESSSIMEFYAKWTGNKIKDKDKYAYEEIQNFDIKVIQLGILLSVARAKQRIGSFKYCTHAINEVASNNKIGNKDDYMQYLINFINKKNR